MWPKFMRILLKRIVDSGYISLRNYMDAPVLVCGMNMDPDIIVITNQGLNFLDEIGLHEM